MSPSGAGGTEAHPFPSPHSVFRDGPPPHLLGVTRHLFHPSPWNAPWWPGGGRGFSGLPWGWQGAWAQDGGRHGRHGGPPDPSLTDNRGSLKP